MNKKRPEDSISTFVFLYLLANGPPDGLTRYELRKRLNLVLSRISPPLPPGTVYHSIDKLIDTDLIKINHEVVSEGGDILLLPGDEAGNFLDSKVSSTLIKLFDAPFDNLDQGALLYGLYSSKIDNSTIKKIKVNLIKYKQLSDSLTIENSLLGDKLLPLNNWLKLKIEAAWEWVNDSNRLAGRQ